MIVFRGSLLLPNNTHQDWTDDNDDGDAINGLRLTMDDDDDENEDDNNDDEDEVLDGEDKDDDDEISI